MERIITLTTDFGAGDGFVGMMKGVILSINPRAVIVDITHDLAPHHIEQGAFLFANAARYFPPRAIHVVVVDPGVGSARRPLAMQLGETLFVAPDNGVLTHAIDHWRLSVAHPKIRAVRLANPAYFLPRISNTFHGRDLFAPVAAHLSLGVPLDALGTPLDDWVELERVAARRLGERIIGRVAHIDHFGNIVTNIEEEMLAGLDRARLVIRIGKRALRGIQTTYASAAPGDTLALISSSWHLEIAVREGNAAQSLGIRLGDAVVVETQI